MTVDQRGRLRYPCWAGAATHACSRRPGAVSNASSPTSFASVCSPATNALSDRPLDAQRCYRVTPTGRTRRRRRPRRGRPIVAKTATSRQSTGVTPLASGAAHVPSHGRREPPAQQHARWSMIRGHDRCACTLTVTAELSSTAAPAGSKIPTSDPRCTLQPSRLSLGGQCPDLAALPAEVRATGSGLLGSRRLYDTAATRSDEVSRRAGKRRHATPCQMDIDHDPAVSPP